MMRARCCSLSMTNLTSTNRLTMAARGDREAAEGAAEAAAAVDAAVEVAVEVAGAAGVVVDAPASTCS